MRTLPLLFVLTACSSQASSPPTTPSEATAPAEPEGVVRFSFAVNGLEHGNGAL